MRKEPLYYTKCINGKYFNNYLILNMTACYIYNLWKNAIILQEYSWKGKIIMEIIGKW